MRIGMICPYSFDEPGGVQIHAIDLCTELIRRGHEVSLIGQVVIAVKYLISLSWAESRSRFGTTVQLPG